MRKIKWVIISAIITLLIICVAISVYNYNKLYYEDKSSIIEGFEKHRDIFMQIQQYALTTRGLLHVDVMGTNNYDVTNTGGDPIEDSAIVKKDVGVLVTTLHYQGIFELPDNTIQFKRQAENDERGIVYSPVGRINFLLQLMRIWEADGITMKHFTNRDMEDGYPAWLQV